MLSIYNALCGSENNHALYIALLFWAGIFIWVATSLCSRQVDRRSLWKDPPNLAEAIPGCNIIRLIRGTDCLAQAVMSVHLTYIAFSTERQADLQFRCSTRFGYDIPVAFRLGPFKSYAVSNAKYFDRLLKGKATRSLRSDPGIMLGMRLLFGLLKKDQPFYNADTSGIAHTPMPGSNVELRNRIHFLRHTAATKFFNAPNVRDMTSRFCGLLDSQFEERGDIDSDWVSAS